MQSHGTLTALPNRAVGRAHFGPVAEAIAQEHAAQYTRGIVAAQAGSRAQVFVLGDELRLENPVQGLGLIAPNARVTVTAMANNTKLSVLAGKVVEVQPGVRLTCDRAASLPTP